MNWIMLWCWNFGRRFWCLGGFGVRRNWRCRIGRGERGERENEGDNQKFLPSACLAVTGKSVCIFPAILLTRGVWICKRKVHMQVFKILLGVHTGLNNGVNSKIKNQKSKRKKDNGVNSVVTVLWNVYWDCNISPRVVECTFRKQPNLFFFFFFLFFPPFLSNKLRILKVKIILSTRLL